MIAVITILTAFPLGYFQRNRSAAMTMYAVAYLWAFTYQAVYLLPMFLQDNLAVQGDGRAVEMREVFPWDYGLVTLGIFLVGIGLVEGGHRFRARRAARGVDRPVATVGA